MLNDPDLGVSAADINKIAENIDLLPKPEKMIEGGQNSRKANSYGFMTLKIKDKLRKYDFVKLREKDVKVKMADIKKLEETINKMREAAGGRRLQQVEEVAE